MLRSQRLARLARPALFALAALALLAPRIQPASAAAVDPNSPKGSFSGTYISDDQTLSGPIKLVISSAKRASPGVETLVIKGKLTIGTKVKNKPYIGTYTPANRLVAGGAAVRKGYGGGFSGTLSADGKTLTGEWGYNRTPENDDQHQGTATLTRP